MSATDLRPPRQATVSRALGLVSLLFFWVCGVGLLGLVAIVQGVRARRMIVAAGGALPGGGLATAGIVTGVLAVLLTLLALYSVVDYFMTGNAM